MNNSLVHNFIYGSSNSNKYVPFCGYKKLSRFFINRILIMQIKKISVGLIRSHSQIYWFVFCIDILIFPTFSTFSVCKYVILSFNSLSENLIKLKINVYKTVFFYNRYFMLINPQFHLNLVNVLFSIFRLYSGCRLYLWTFFFINLC